MTTPSKAEQKRPAMLKDILNPSGLRKKIESLETELAVTRRALEMAGGEDNAEFWIADARKERGQ